MKRITFACGAFMDVRQWEPTDRRCVVFTNPPQNHERPTPGPDWLEFAGLKEPASQYRMNCLLLCPVSQRASGRKVETGFLGEKQEHGRIVTCKVQTVVEMPEPQEEGGSR